jgi:hypothetical protein
MLTVKIVEYLSALKVLFNATHSSECWARVSFGHTNQTKATHFTKTACERCCVHFKSHLTCDL